MFSTIYFSQLKSDCYHLAVECILNEHPVLDMEKCPVSEELLQIVTKHFTSRIDAGLFL